MTSSVRRILRRQGMPPEEIRTVLATSDRHVVRRILELHRERLGEWLEEQRGLVDSIERSLEDRSPTIAAADPMLR